MVEWSVMSGTVFQSLKTRLGKALLPNDPTAVFFLIFVTALFKSVWGYCQQKLGEVLLS